MSHDPSVLRLHETDNVAVALRDIASGEALGFGKLRALEDIPAGHKVALADIPAGQVVSKYGQPIGRAGAGITAGAHVHVHNVRAEHGAAAEDAVPRVRPWPQSDAASSFEGFRRDNGLAGTRNYVGIVSTVNCSATVVRKIGGRFTDEVLADYPHVDGIVPVTHGSGCGMAAGGEGFALLQRTLRGFIGHPNFGGVLVIGLGCETNEIGRLLGDDGSLVQSPALRSMTIQAAGGTQEAIGRGERELRELLDIANQRRRETLPASQLTLGLQCGASDAFSGISANPALGVAADRLVRAGGSVLLAETPEIHGAEQLLIRRAETPQVAADLRARLDWWQDYVARNGATLDNNPSPGNIAGGISTILEKSLGAVAKSGSSPLRGVVSYGERPSLRGFVFMDSPGYDPCSVTGEIAAGANVICFTTGRGSVFGAKPSPSIKLATNSELARRMGGDIDFDCGPILANTMSLEEAGAGIFQLILETASGRKSASELSDFGDLEFVPWQLGAVL
ncbi:MAG: UxaA family hydrolase [Woeseiaceae bacterium]